MMINRLFVYGTLAPGRPNEHILRDLPGSWEPAIIRGWLVPEGWGAAAGYPGIVPDQSGDEIQGFVFTSEHLAENWLMLDEFEGEDYERRPVTAHLVDGRAIDVFIYQLNRPGSTTGAPESGQP